MRKLIVVLVTLGLALSGSHASALFPVVQVKHDSFDPHTFKKFFDVSFGWHNDTSKTHTVEMNASVPGSYSTGLDPGETTTPDNFPDSVGSYPYHCEMHCNFSGVIGSMPTVDTASKPLGNSFTLTWATDPGGSINYDIQVKKPGSDHYVSLFPDETSVSGSYAPDRRGTYKIRGRTQKPSSGEATGYGPPVELLVT